MSHNSWPPIPSEFRRLSYKQRQRIRNILETQYSLFDPDLLRPAPPLIACANVHDPPLDFDLVARFELLQLWINKPPSPDDLPLHVLRACKLSDLKKCESKPCQWYKVILERKHQPPSPSCPQLLAWATQLAACVCAANREYVLFRRCCGEVEPCDRCRRKIQLSKIKFGRLLWRFRLIREPIIGGFNAATGDSLGFSFDFKGVRFMEPRLPEVINVLSWLEHIVTDEIGSYMSPLYGVIDTWQRRTLVSRNSYHINSNSAEADLKKALGSAFEKLKQSGLCPARVRAILQSIPGSQHHLGLFLDVPFRIPKQKCHADCSYNSPCQRSMVNYPDVEPLHKCRYPALCTKTDISWLDRTKLDEASIHLSDISRAWSLDGLRLLQKHERFMAISHVWADGTGSSLGVVNQCLFDFWARWARDHECMGIWWDAICLPRDNPARQKALAMMHRNFADAYCTLVHDTYLCENVEWDDENPGKGAVALVLSTWFTRAWPALELRVSKRVKVLFKAPMSARGGRPVVVKDLDHDILTHPKLPSSRYHQIASLIIRCVRSMPYKSQLCQHRPSQIFGFNGPRDSNINELLMALQMRVTTQGKDRAVIAALMANISESETLATAQEAYRAIARRVGFIQHENLLHALPTMNGNFSWLPYEMLDMPISSQVAGQVLLGTACRIMDDGRVFGKWRVRFLHHHVYPCSFQGAESPMLIYQSVGMNYDMVSRSANAQSTISERRKHALLFPPRVRNGNALLVKKVGRIQYRHGQLIMCVEYIGCVIYMGEFGRCLKEDDFWVYIGGPEHPALSSTGSTPITSMLRKAYRSARIRLRLQNAAMEKTGHDKAIDTTYLQIDKD